MLWHELEAELVRSGLPPTSARDLVFAALAQGALTVTRPAPMVEQKEIQGNCPRAAVVEMVHALLPAGVVATLPVVHNAEHPPTLVAFRQIIAAATAHLYLVSPFIDGGGVALLYEALAEAVRRQVEIRLLTRQVADRQASRTAGLERLFTLGKSQVQVRDYHTKARGLAHFTSVHAKLVLADAAIGYVGSAEVRANALTKNFELGSIIKGTDAANALDAFNSVWEAAKAVRPRGR